MACWTIKICPQTISLGDKYANYITQRIQDVATAVGAPVDVNPAYRPNIEAVFTTLPQGLMDNIRKSAPLFLGYHDNSHHADKLAKVTHAIEAWYTTQSQDWDGNTMIDGSLCNDTAIDVYTIGRREGPEFSDLVLPCAMFTHALGGVRLNNSLNSGFFNILIVGEPAKLSDYEVGSLAVTSL